MKEIIKLIEEGYAVSFEREGNQFILAIRKQGLNKSYSRKTVTLPIRSSSDVRKCILYYIPVLKDAIDKDLK
jgi:hypothetical protein